MARLIDSSVLITLERRRLTLASLFGLMAPEEDVAMAAVTVSEMLVGIHRANSEARRLGREVLLNAVLEEVPVLAFDVRVARTYGRLLADLAAAGQKISPHDGMIAATALTHGYGVLTENARDFARIPGLDVVTPHWA